MFDAISYFDNHSRREFLKRMSAAAAATLAAGAPRPAQGSEPVTHPAARADTCILLWMGGGMASPETFDPKRYTPFEVGVPSEKILCTFPAIDTSVDNIKITKGLENIAQVMDRATLLRGHVVADLGNILHSRPVSGTRLRPASNRRCPHLGSWIAKVRPEQSAIPPFISIGQRWKAWENPKS